MYLKYIVLAFLLAGISGCSHNNKIVIPVIVSAQDSPTVKKMYEQYKQWEGVRYREGGMSKKGVDCSGYVHLTYKNKLNKKIPRTTELLSKSGKKIHSSKLKPGDLVFFKTGWKKRHVGIYIKEGKFMHASSSRGVMISKLNNPYWSDAFWMARRL